MPHIGTIQNVLTDVLTFDCSRATCERSWSISCSKDFTLLLSMLNLSLKIRTSCWRLIISSIVLSSVTNILSIPFKPDNISCSIASLEIFFKEEIGTKATNITNVFKLTNLQRCIISISCFLFIQHRLVLYQFISFFANCSKLPERNKQRHQSNVFLAQERWIPTYLWILQRMSQYHMNSSWDNLGRRRQ